MSAETYGSPVPSYVFDQIEARQEVFGSNAKTRLQQQYVNSNTSWVKLRSSVNEIDETAAKKLLNFNANLSSEVGTQTKAKNNILTGGTLNSDKRYRAGIKRGAIGDNDPQAYLNYESIGFRPMPGIQSISVSHKNNMGTLMEARVNFVAWSREQLDDFELLYFRPGYTALLEWGHSVYIKDKQIEFASDAMTVPHKDFFENGKGAEFIDKEIVKRREAYQGNYQGMFGFITNFSWAFRPDGGYDCEIKISSRGIVIESIKNSKASQGTNGEETKSAAKNPESENSGAGLKSIWHTIFEVLSRSSKTDIKLSGKEILTEKKFSTLAGKIIKQLQNTKTGGEESTNDFNIIGYKIAVQEKAGFFNAIGALLAGKDNLAYISMRTFLAIVNAFEMLKDPAGSKELISPFSIRYGNTYRTFPEHFSSNPGFVILPKVAGPGDNYKRCVVGDYTNSANSVAASLSGNKTNDILNIYLSSPFILGEISKIIDTPTEKGVGVLDFIKNILAGMRHALGGVNEFDIHFDHDVQQYMIIDRRDPATKDKQPRKINVTGLSNTVVDFSVQTTISKETAAQVSIAAQGHTGNYRENLENILQWNRGAVDRHILSKQQDSPEEEANPKKDQAKGETVLDKVVEAYGDVRSGNSFFTLTTLDMTELSNLSVEMSAIQAVNLYKNTKDKSIFDPLPVPVSISLTLKGISGFKIGTIFNINDFALPKKYKKFSYIVRGVSHDIGEDNRWYTTVEAYMYQTGK